TSVLVLCTYACFVFFHHPATTEISTLSLHDALPIFMAGRISFLWKPSDSLSVLWKTDLGHLDMGAYPASPYANHLKTLPGTSTRSEEHTSELQSRRDLVCRLLLEKKKKENIKTQTSL